VVTGTSSFAADPLRLNSIGRDTSTKRITASALVGPYGPLRRSPVVDVGMPRARWPPLEASMPRLTTIQNLQHVYDHVTSTTVSTGASIGIVTRRNVCHSSPHRRELPRALRGPAAAKPAATTTMVKRPRSIGRPGSSRCR